VNSLPLVKKFGDYSGQALSGFFQETLEASFPSTQMFGLNIDATVPNALLFDEEGNSWLVVRHAGYSSSLGLQLRTNAEGKTLSEGGPTPDAYAGPISHRLEGEAHIIESLVPADNPFYYSRSLDKVEWREGDIMSLEGPRLCPGKSWFVRDDEGGWGFTSYISKLSGTLMGRKVVGFSEFAVVFMPPGQSFATEFPRKGASWLIICNEYEGGEYDFCHVGVLADGSSFGLIADQNGAQVCAKSVDFETKVNEDGYPDQMIYTVDGERWIWTPSPNSYVSPLSHPFQRDRIGVGQREGDKRTPILSYGWVNFFNDGRLDPYMANR